MPIPILRRAVVVGALMVLASSDAFAQKVDRAAVQTQIIANEKAINDAVVKNDMKTFHGYVAADAMNLDGMGLTKAADFDKMLAEYKVTSANVSESQFQWLDDNHVVHMYKWTGKGTFQGQPIPETTWSGTVWSNKGGKWLATFHAEAMAMPMPPAKK